MATVSGVKIKEGQNGRVEKTLNLKVTSLYPLQGIVNRHSNVHEALDQSDLLHDLFAGDHVVKMYLRL